MIKSPRYNLEHEENFKKYLKLDDKSDGTIRVYVNRLNMIKGDVFEFFGNPQLKGKHLKISAYRAYIKYLCDIEDITPIEEAKLLRLYKPIPKKKRASNGDNSKYAIPEEEWEDYISKAPNQMSKMAIWVGFSFGLRNSEICNLQVSDIDFDEQKLSIQPHEDGWTPKSGVKRLIPITLSQATILQQWIDDYRAKDLNHDFLLYNERTKRIIHPDTLRTWCKKVSDRLTKRKFTPHIMRYSFATHYYFKSNQNIYLIMKLLGHSNPKITATYLKLEEDELLDMARDLFSA